eukprot:GILI01019899.1.p1 GENE.GILI01019899.1~~GILI01019899.1.p1  ORF type:complete len:357 (+),score=69.64 GILI01019899.1:95-1165(+)
MFKSPFKALSFIRSVNGETVLLIAIWYFSSICTTYLNGAVLDRVPSAVTLCLLHIAGSFGCGFFLYRTAKVHFVPNISREIVKEVLPISACFLFAAVFYAVSITLVPVSLTQTVKSASPLFTVFLCRVFMKEMYSFKTYFSLIPVVVGVGLASGSEVNFDVLGFVTAVASVSCHAVMSLLSKLVTSKKPASPASSTGLPSTSSPAPIQLDDLGLQYFTMVLGVPIILPMWITFGGPQDLFTSFRLTTSMSDWWDLFVLLIVGAITYHVEITLCFCVLSSVSPLSFSIIDVVRRLIVIISSVFIFGNVLTPANKLGVVTATIGVILYNISVANAKKHHKVLTSPPTAVTVKGSEDND